MNDHHKFLAAASACYIGVVGLFIHLVAERWLSGEAMAIFRKSSFPLTFAISLLYEFGIKPENWKAVLRSLGPMLAGIAVLAITR